MLNVRQFTVVNWLQCLQRSWRSMPSNESRWFTRFELPLQLLRITPCFTLKQGFIVIEALNKDKGYKEVHLYLKFWAYYWHLVDLIWISLFILLYLRIIHVLVIGKTLLIDKFRRLLVLNSFTILNLNYRIQVKNIVQEFSIANILGFTANLVEFLSFLLIKTKYKSFVDYRAVVRTPTVCWR